MTTGRINQITTQQWSSRAQASPRQELEGAAKNTFKPYKLFIWLQTHCCVRGKSARPPVFYHSKQAAPHPYSPLKILPVWCPCDCTTTRTAAHVEHRQPWRELHSAKSQILLRLLAKAYPRVGFSFQYLLSASNPLNPSVPIHRIVRYLVWDCSGLPPYSGSPMPNVAYKVGRDVYITSRLSPLVDLALNTLQQPREELSVFLQLSFLLSHIVPPSAVSHCKNVSTNKLFFQCAPTKSIWLCTRQKVSLCHS